MFEKEAEEYIKKDGTETEKMLNNITLSLTSREAFVLKNAFKQTFKDGAEFGYNKANEWHYVKDGDLPKDEKEVLVYMWGSFYIGYYSEKYDENERWHFEDFSEESEQVTAWKEIVLPKESE